MKKEYTVEKVTETRSLYTFSEVNGKSEKIVIELLECTNSKSKKSLPCLWVKHGFIDRILDTYLCVNTYVTDKNGNCAMQYNPQIKAGKINFEWMFEVSEDNKQRLIDEIFRLANTTDQF